MWDDIEKISRNKNYNFKIGDKVYNRNTERRGIVNGFCNYDDRCRVVSNTGKLWEDLKDLEHVPITNIRSIKSLYTKAANNPSSNHAEEKAIILFDKLVDECKRTFFLTSQDGQEIYLLKPDRTERLFKECEKLALQYYRKIRL